MKFTFAAAALFAATAQANDADVDLSALTDSLKDLGVDTSELEGAMTQLEDLQKQLETMAPSAEQIAQMQKDATESLSTAQQ